MFRATTAAAPHKWSLPATYLAVSLLLGFGTMLVARSYVPALGHAHGHHEVYELVKPLAVAQPVHPHAAEVRLVLAQVSPVTYQR